MSTTKMHYTSNNEGDCNLKELTLNQDEHGYYLTAVYEYEDLETKRAVTFHKIRLPISRHDAIVSHEYSPYSLSYVTNVDIGLGPMQMGLNKDCIYFTDKVLETKTREMTLEEIEKQLGHKVKIVNK